MASLSVKLEPNLGCLTLLEWFSCWIFWVFLLFPGELLVFLFPYLALFFLLPPNVPLLQLIFSKPISTGVAYCNIVGFQSGSLGCQVWQGNVLCHVLATASMAVDCKVSKDWLPLDTKLSSTIVAVPIHWKCISVSRPVFVPSLRYKVWEVWTQYYFETPDFLHK